MLVTVKKPAGDIQFYNDGCDVVVALAGSLPRAATDDENVEVWERVFDAPSPEDAIILMIDAKRGEERKAHKRRNHAAYRVIMGI
jgi:hypothetical protein